MEKKPKPNLVVVSAKVPPSVRVLIEKKAAKDDRSISQIICRLLSSHPDLKGKKSLALQS